MPKNDRKALYPRRGTVFALPAAALPGGKKEGEPLYEKER